MGIERALRNYINGSRRVKEDEVLAYGSNATINAIKDIDLIFLSFSINALFIGLKLILSL